MNIYILLEKEGCGGGGVVRWVRGKQNGRGGVVVGGVGGIGKTTLFG